MIRQVVIAVCVVAPALLSGCVSNVAGSATKPANAESWVRPLGEDDIARILLDISELNDVVGASTMEATTDVDDLTDSSGEVANQECLGAFYAGEERVYADANWTAADNMIAREPEDNWQHWAQQLVVLFPSSAESEGFFDTAVKAWQHCDGQTVNIYGGPDADGDAWTLEDAVVKESTLSQRSELADSDGLTCDHAMSVVSNVIIEAVVCSRSDTAATALADRLVDNVAAR